MSGRRGACGGLPSGGAGRIAGRQPPRDGFGIRRTRHRASLSRARFTALHQGRQGRARGLPCLPTKTPARRRLDRPHTARAAGVSADRGDPPQRHEAAMLAPYPVPRPQPLGPFPALYGDSGGGSSVGPARISEELRDAEHV